MRTSRKSAGAVPAIGAPHLGPLAIRRGNAAKRARANDPRLGGASLATFGQILGLLDILAFFVALMLIGR